MTLYGLTLDRAGFGPSHHSKQADLSVMKKSSMTVHLRILHALVQDEGMHQGMLRDGRKIETITATTTTKIEEHDWHALSVMVAVIASILRPSLIMP